MANAYAESEGHSGDSKRRTGIDVVGEVPWGTHFCQFYQTTQDLVETLVPYFREGLLANEFCMWVTSAPLEREEAIAALKAGMPDLEDRILNDQIEVLDYSQWYTRSGRFDSDLTLAGWMEKLEDATRRGFEGLRLSGNTYWLEESNWKDFEQYEAKINGVTGKHRIMALCTYSLEQCGAAEILDVIRNHEFALIRKSGKWELIESSTTEQLKKDLQKALKRSEYDRLRLQLILDSLPVAVTVVDSGGELVLANKEAIDVLGTTLLSSIDLAEQMQYVGFSTGSVKRLDPEEWPIIRSLRKGEAVEDYEMDIQRVRGPRLTVLASSKSIRDSNGDLIGAIATYSDITTLKRLEQNLVRLNTDLEQYAYASSHDLQEPLRLIAGHLELLLAEYRGKVLDAQAESYLTTAIDASKRMYDLIEDMLAYSRVTAQPRTSEPVRMDRIVEIAVKNLEAQTRDANAVITRDPLPEINAERPQMILLMQNLLGNAVKFHGSEAPRVHISAARENNGWVFSVKDNGIGIAEKDNEKIFEMFKRLHSRRKYPGTGMGLAICKRIVERHSGRIWLESAEGAGSTFFFSIPDVPDPDAIQVER